MVDIDTLKTKHNFREIQKAVLLFSVLIVLSIPALLGKGVIRSTVNLLPQGEINILDIRAEFAPYVFIYDPIVVLSTFLLFLSPGLLITLALNEAKSYGQWISYSLLVSIILISITAEIARELLQVPLVGTEFGFVIIACLSLAFGVLLFRILKGGSIQWPSRIYVSIIICLVAVWILLVGLAPKIYWENFNGDGAHAHETARLLLVQPLPFWDSAAGDIASFPGLTSMLFAFPASWFIRFFGDFEASSRLPYFLYLIGVFGIITALIDERRRYPIGIQELVLVWLSLVVYTVTVTYSATYNPYTADLALPATQDTLTMVCYLGFILAFIMRKSGWMIFLMFLTLFALPNSILLIFFWLAGVMLFYRPIPFRDILLTLLGLVSFIVLSIYIPKILASFQLPVPGNEYGLIGILKRFAFLQISDFKRILYVIIPGGILPALSVLLWRWHDQISKSLTFVSVLLFLFFYFQAFTALHYFIPSMLLPIIIFWRNKITFIREKRVLILSVTAALGIFAFVISLPKSFEMDQSGRMIGATIDNRVDGYNLQKPEVHRSALLLANLFPYDWDPRVPGNSYGGSPIVWNYYSFHKNGQTKPINYVLQNLSDKPPSGMELIASNAWFALYMRDETILSAQRAMRPNTPAGSPVYAIPRGYLFRSITSNGTAVINVIDVLQGLGFDLTPVLQKLGVEVPR